MGERRYGRTRVDWRDRLAQTRAHNAASVARSRIVLTACCIFGFVGLGGMTLQGLGLIELEAKPSPALLAAGDWRAGSFFPSLLAISVALTLVVSWLDDPFWISSRQRVTSAQIAILLVVASAAIPDQLAMLAVVFSLLPAVALAMHLHETVRSSGEIEASERYLLAWERHREVMQAVDGSRGAMSHRLQRLEVGKARRRRVAGARAAARPHGAAEAAER